MCTAQIIIKKSSFFLLFILVFTSNFFAQTVAPAALYQFVKGDNFVQSKNYYLLTLLQYSPKLKKMLATDSVFTGIAKAKSATLNEAIKNCNRDGNCYLSAMKFSDAEIKSISERLAALYEPKNELGKLVQNHLLPSGTYVQFQNLSAKEMLVKAWEQDANGINYCIGVYAGGNKPNYPAIDSISYNVKDPSNHSLYDRGYTSFLYNTVSLIALESKTNTSFFYPSLTFAIRFLEMNERQQAADFEPMMAGENKLAVDRIKTLKWNNFKYSVILVPGAGPDNLETPLSAEGMLRCRLAAIQFQNGLAPFIVTSGGKAHPYKTKYCEATEMKKFLMEQLHIPANAIIIDPHARHTTTNMRNAARLLFRYGMPFEKPAITCTTKGQSNMIGTTLIARCLKELNEVPYKIGLRLSETELEFYPLIGALHINPLEPMDP